MYKWKFVSKMAYRELKKLFDLQKMTSSFAWLDIFWYLLLHFGEYQIVN